MTEDDSKNITLVEPVALVTAPQVNELLERIGLGTLDDTDVTSYRGRNDNWAGTTSSGRKVFVKRLVGQPSDIQRRIHNLAGFARLYERATPKHYRTPKLLGYDLHHGLVVHERMEGSTSGLQLAGDKEFGEDIARKIGAAYADLHNHEVDPDSGDLGRPPYPPKDQLVAIPGSMFANLAAAAIEVWAIIHSDKEVAKCLSDLADQAVSYTKPIHGDVRLDQLVFDADGALHLIDWEEFRLGDPARDIGAFAGEWLFRSISEIPVTIAKEHGDDATYQATDLEIISTGSAELEKLKPLITAFWSGYTATVCDVPADLAARSVAWAGWHMFDRMFAFGDNGNHVPALYRAAAGIGRTAMLAPEKFTATIGLEAE